MQKQPPDRAPFVDLARLSLPVGVTVGDERQQVGEFELVSLWHDTTRLQRSLLTIPGQPPLSSTRKAKASTSRTHLIPLMTVSGDPETFAAVAIPYAIGIWIEQQRTQLRILERGSDGGADELERAFGLVGKQTLTHRVAGEKMLVEQVSQALQDLSARATLVQSESPSPTTQPERQIQDVGRDHAPNSAQLPGSALEYALLSGDLLWSWGPFSVVRVWLEWRHFRVGTPIYGTSILGQGVVIQAHRALFDDGKEPPFEVATWWRDEMDETSSYSPSVVLEGVMRDLHLMQLQVRKLKAQVSVMREPANDHEPFDSESYEQVLLQYQTTRDRYARVHRGSQQLKLHASYDEAQ